MTGRKEGERDRGRQRPCREPVTRSKTPLPGSDRRRVCRPQHPPGPAALFSTLLRLGVYAPDACSQRLDGLARARPVRESSTKERSRDVIDGSRSWRPPSSEALHPRALTGARESSSPQGARIVGWLQTSERRIFLARSYRGAPRVAREGCPKRAEGGRRGRLKRLPNPWTGVARLAASERVRGEAVRV